MTTPLPHDHYDRKPRLTSPARPSTAAGNTRTVKGYVSYNGKLAEGRRLILAGIIHATGMGLMLHSINILEDAEKNEASLRYMVEGTDTAIAVFTEALNTI